MSKLQFGTPESVGIPSQAIWRLLDELEYGGFSEMHGIAIMRDDCLCAQGWWAPYAPGKRHGLQSLSKTFTATAVGLLEYQRRLSLEERLLDIFPEKAPAEPSERLKQMTVRHALMMACGMRREVAGSPDWIRDFFAIPVVAEPGTEWFYNTQGTTLLSAVVERRTGMDMLDYMNQELFPALGINRANLRSIHMQDGVTMGGVGLFATTLDALVLMRLYLHRGVIDGVRYLGEQFVQEATSPLMDTMCAHREQPWIFDNRCGYGYQIWRGAEGNSYRADGAMGQFSVVYPEQKLIVAITQTGELYDDPAIPHGPQQTLNALNRILLPALSSAPLPPDPAMNAKLQQRLNRLAIPRPPFRLLTASAWKYENKWYVLENDAITILPYHEEFFSKRCLTTGAEKFCFHFSERDLILRWCENGKEMELRGAMDGSYAQNICPVGDWPLDELYLSACWEDEGRLTILARWVETCYTQRLSFFFNGNTCCVSAERYKGNFCTEGIKKSTAHYEKQEIEP